MAVRKPNQLKDRSVAEAITTPATIGTSVSITGRLGVVPMKRYESATVKNGSRDFMVCVRETFTAPSDMLVVRKPSRCSTERGITVSTMRRETDAGGSLTRKIQRDDMRMLATMR